MARYKIPYPSLNESLKHLRIQVIDSLPYAVKHLPRFNSPEQIFKYCKNRYTYKNDPAGIELFQTVPTLLTDNEHGRSGEGDCDDATIFCLTMLLISGFTDCGIVLTGRNKLKPSHIYAYVNDNGQRKILDLTNKNFDQERPYPFKQFIPFKISKNQLDMFLQLADSPNPFKRFKTNKPTIKRLTAQQKQKAVYIPSKNVFIPLEKFDKLPIKKASQTLLSEGYEVDQLSEYLSGRKERKERKAYRTEKKKIKLEKSRAKVDVKKAKAEKKRATASKRIAKGEASKIKAKAKQIKATKGGSGQGMQIFNKVTDVAKGFVNRKQGGEEEEEENIFAPQYAPEEVEAEEVEAEEVEAEEVEAEPQEENQEFNFDLQEGFTGLNRNDLLNGAFFALGIYLEKTKKVA